MNLTEQLKKLVFLDFHRSETVFEAVLKTSFLNLLARSFGYLKNVAIAVLLGFSAKTDGVFMALSLIGIFLIFVDVFDSIGVPNLVNARLESEKKFKQLSGFLLTLTTFLALTILIISLLLFPLIIKVPFGFSEKAINYTKIAYFLFIPYLFLNFFSHHFGAILRSLRLFSSYFLGEFLFSLFSFIFIGTGLYLFRDYKVIPVGYFFSQLIATFYLLYLARKHIFFNFYKDETTTQILKHFFYLSFLYAVFHINILIDRAFASFLPEKSVSALTYGFLIVSIPRGILKFENIAITPLSETKGSLKKFNFYAKKLIFLNLPFVFIMMFLSEVFVKLLFGYGAFSKVDIELTAQAVRFYSLSLPFMFLWPLLYRLYQVKNILKPVFFIAIIGILTNFIFTYLFVIFLNLAIIGICLSTFISYTILTLIGYIYLYIKNNFKC